MNEYPIIFVRGYGGPTSQIDVTVDDAFYGFNEGATHVRIDGDGDPMYYQYEGPLLRLLTEHDYQFLVHGDQKRFLDIGDSPLPAKSVWVHRFYDSAATTWQPAKKLNIFEKIGEGIHEHLSSDGYDLEQAASGLYELIVRVLTRTGAPKVHLVAHSMGGLVVRSMMQKVCETPDADGRARRPAKEIVCKFFTFGTPHGGIEFTSGALNWAMQAFGTAGTDIFSPAKMYGYLTPGKKWGDTPGHGDEWDPQVMPAEIFDVDDIFCLIGTDPVDYGISKSLVGPKSDGLVRIEHAYVRGAHRAFVYKSHSGRYGEVNSEEGYQNLQRFLFAKWSVRVDFAGLTTGAELDPSVAWQADMRLAIRGLPVVMSEQVATRWCPIQLNEEITRRGDSVDAPVPVVGTFIFPKEPPKSDGEGVESDTAALSRYVLTLRVFKLKVNAGGFDFSDHIEQVYDWSDSLIVDIGTPSTGASLGAFTAWNSELMGAIDTVKQMPNELGLAPVGAGFSGTIPLPASARALPIFGPNAGIRITTFDRESAANSA